MDHRCARRRLWKCVARSGKGVQELFRRARGLSVVPTLWLERQSDFIGIRHRETLATRLAHGRGQLEPPPKVEDVTEKVAIVGHYADLGTVYLAEPDEVRALVVEALRKRGGETAP